MRQVIKPGTRYPFIQNADKFLMGSAAIVVLSVILLLTNGLHLGIDFKGGNKLLVSFTADAADTIDNLKENIGALITEKTGGPAGQIEVQSFDVGDVDTQGRKVVKYQIYTELTTFLTDEAAGKIQEAIKAQFEVASVERPAETDKFILVLKSDQNVTTTKQKLLGVLKGLGYTYATAVAEEERAIDMEFYKEYNLSVAERSKEGKEIPDNDFETAVQVHEAKKTQLLSKRLDATYTISLQQIQAEVEAALFEKYGKDKVEVESATAVSPSVGADLFNKGMLAMIYAIIGILIYIGLRFDFRYSPGAVVALVHDTTITLGIFSLFGIKFTLPIISALLTIIGYSLNDTIVVYDRIRENLTKFRGMELGKLINQSINETLSRTVLTSVTTLFVVLSLLFVGGGLIRDFALALTIGVIIGTYSSVFIASPIVMKLDSYLEARKARATSQAAA